MKSGSWIILLLLLLTCNSLYSQHPEWYSYAGRMNEINRTGMYVLGSWAVLNITAGGIANFSTSGSLRYFHRMNVYWNIVNLGIAGFGLLRPSLIDPPFSELLNRQLGYERAFLFNGGLDIAYMAGGAFLIERSRNIQKNNDRWKGYGQSVILQGAFLLGFDLIMYAVHRHHFNLQLAPFLEGPTGYITGISMYLNW